MKTRSIGFTLIELLIVIAIIAILALIAIPNFLQAQTRAKVSRVMADMRSVATALEAYFVDNNAYPILRMQTDRLDSYESYAYFMKIQKCESPRADRSYYQCVNLTTPIAYITSIPMDPFGDDQTSVSGGVQCQCDEFSVFYFNFLDHLRIAKTLHPSLLWNKPERWPIPKQMRLNGVEAGIHHVNWALLSSGPDQTFNNNFTGTNPPTKILTSSNKYKVQALTNPQYSEYDPTNGITSLGDIWRFSDSVE